MPVVREEGSLRNLRVLGYPLKNSAGEVSEFVGTLVDITGQLRSRKALEDGCLLMRPVSEILRPICDLEVRGDGEERSLGLAADDIR